MHTLFALLLSFLGPYSASSNMSVDLLGVLDTRQDTWGYSGSVTWSLTFKPPAGYRVHILRLDGDLIAWPKVLPGEPPIPEGTVSGLLLGFQTTAPDGSTRCDYCADDCMVYIQGVTGAQPTRSAFDRDVSANGLLEADNILHVKAANFLNTTGKPIHMEPTFNVTYRYEEISK